MDRFGFGHCMRAGAIHGRGGTTGGPSGPDLLIESAPDPRRPGGELFDQCRRFVHDGGAAPSGAAPPGPDPPPQSPCATSGW